MRKESLLVMVVCLFLVLVFPACSESERYAKEFDVTYDDVIYAYDNAPSSLFGSKIPLVFADLGEKGVRKYYFAQVDPVFDVSIATDNTNDKVVFYSIEIRMKDVKNNEEAKEVGSLFLKLTSRLMFALNRKITPEYVQELLLNKMEFGKIATTSNSRSDHADDTTGLVIALINKENESVTLLLRNEEFYESKEEYLESRGK